MLDATWLPHPPDGEWLRLCFALRTTDRTILATACSGPPVEEALFFPTWDPGGRRALRASAGRLVEEDRCLFVEANGLRTLVVWESGLGFECNGLLDSAGEPIASVGETIHGGGGYYGDRSHIENLARGSDPGEVYPPGRR